jgi:hypothetical protein
MTGMTEITKLWKDVQASAREFASTSLHWSARAVDLATTRLKTLEENLKKRAADLQSKDGGADEAPATDVQVAAAPEQLAEGDKAEKAEKTTDGKASRKSKHQS